MPVVVRGPARRGAARFKITTWGPGAFPQERCKSPVGGPARLGSASTGIDKPRDNPRPVRQGVRMIAPPGMPLQVQPLAEADLPDILELDSTAFGQDPPDGFLDDLIVPWLELDRFIGVRDPEADDELVAVGCILSKQLTFPGGRVHDAAGVTWISVRPGWRRRGLLRALMTAQLHGLHDTGGEPVAILTASEAGLYGRFGYGRAVDRCRFALTHGAEFRPGVRTEPVVEIRAERAPAMVRSLYARIAATRPGHLARPDAIWRMRFSDHEVFRRDLSKKHWATHADGYVSYRIKPEWSDSGPNSALVIDEICAGTPTAFASLWRYLLDLDLIREISYHGAWIDDPLRELLVDPRALRISVHDHIWLRLVDIGRAVGLRGYRFPARVVCEISDAFCPWNSGTWTLTLDETGGTATRTGDNPQIHLDIADLAACFLGGTPLGRLVDAGLVHGEPTAISALGAALATDVAPWCPESF